MYVLDTDICSYLMKRAHPAMIERVKSFAVRELKISVVTLFELEYGILEVSAVTICAASSRRSWRTSTFWTGPPPQRAKPAPYGPSSRR